VVLWQTVYIQAALDHLAAAGEEIDPADVARLAPLGHPTITSRAAAGPRPGPRPRRLSALAADISHMMAA
jgi:hypothetical protein